jgi:hypothetical protein
MATTTQTKAEQVAEQVAEWAGVRVALRWLEINAIGERIEQAERDADEAGAAEWQARATKAHAAAWLALAATGGALTAGA